MRAVPHANRPSPFAGAASRMPKSPTGQTRSRSCQLVGPRHGPLVVKPIAEYLKPLSRLWHKNEMYSRPAPPFGLDLCGDEATKEARELTRQIIESELIVRPQKTLAPCLTFM